MFGRNFVRSGKDQWNYNERKFDAEVFKPISQIGTPTQRKGKGEEDKNNKPAQFIGFKSLPIGRKFSFDDPIGNNPNGANTHEDIRQGNANNQDS